MGSHQLGGRKMLTCQNQRPVPLLPGDILQRLPPLAPEINPEDKARDIVLPGPGTDKPGITVCLLSPQLVVDMGQKNLRPAIAGYPVQSMGKTHGVGTAGDSHHNPIPMLQRLPA